MYNSALITDLYELTMMQGYFYKQNNPDVVFEMFFRRNPFQGGYSVFAGLQDLLQRLESLRFNSEDIEYLRSTGIFRDSFLNYLKDFKFTGDLYAMDEGSIVFPSEPLITVKANLMEAQLIESMLLNIINYQTLIATKSSRIFTASGWAQIMEFGLRRAQGIDGALSASRAAYIGGATATSNTFAGKHFGIPVTGTMAHSWIMSFESELEAFRKYAELYPEKVILLIDTYDTLGSGIENAIIVGKELKAQGRNFGVRLDSGDLQYLSEKVRKKLDDAGLEDSFIAVSNDLDENIIRQLVRDEAPIDSWGVGTQLVTGGEDSSLTGVYKLVARQQGDILVPTIKLSDNPEKSTNPGFKQVYRFYDDQNAPLGDLMTFYEDEIQAEKTYRFNHPMFRYKSYRSVNHNAVKPLLTKRLEGGKLCCELPSIHDIRQKVIDDVKKLDRTYKRLINPHIYKVSLSDNLAELKFRMLDERSEKN
ncbi:MAG: nicotinate phosphoribosyltransferase [Spirochaetales bacterium]|uniref:Nicotinate phosphoribosyltransferase n=1 Tax=Candidatus Thalassospirochaeta sargassi TaxID=3119039 RepID=A0AAJ1IDG8_9SPIO|nr:nicotinate phosphoribosyltransferase [Spirochaetales bacterium]